MYGLASGALPLGQFVARDGIIDLAWGHPDPALLPIGGLQRAANAVLARYGADALGYGYPTGPGPLIAWLCDHLGAIDGRKPDPEAVLATAGNSQALDQVATILTKPGDSVLVEAPTYHLAVRILRDHPLNLVPIPSDEDGMRVEALPGIMRALRRGGAGLQANGGRSGRPRLLYCVPTFNNPTGASLPPERRRQLVEFAAEAGIVIVEDDAYGELAYDAPRPPSLWSLAPPGVVVRLGSFSKSLAPGLRAGFLTADAAIVERFRESGQLDSGGGVSHFSSLVIAEFARSGDYSANVARLRAAYRERRDALLDALGESSRPALDWRRPGGGYFAWVALPAGTDARVLLRKAEAAGVGFMTGPSFYAGPIPSAATGRIRLAFTRYGPEALIEAGRRLLAVLDLAAG
jgi:DNA-binding transcriptional MocR family regulator